MLFGNSYCNKFCLAIFLLFLTEEILTAPELKYHSIEELETSLMDFVNSTNNVTYPGLKTEIYSIGQTLGERHCTPNNDTGCFIPNDLWVVSLTASDDEKYGVPNVKLIGTIHGDEPVGKEILLQFLYHLRENFGTDKTISHLLRTTKIHILPCMNPDGVETTDKLNGKLNGRGLMDLDRSFPSKHFLNRIALKAKEAEAVAKWMNETKFVLSISLHSGNKNIVYYPYEVSKKKSTADPYNTPHETPDNDVFEYLVRTYEASWQHLLFNDSRCDKSGIKVNNSASYWNSTNGAMADYNYDYHGCMEIAVQIGCSKFPNESNLKDIWEENKLALVQYLLQAHQGIYGKIFDEATSLPVKADLQISGRNVTFSTTENTGEFWRILLPGNYSLEITAPGYYNKTTRQFTVPNFNPDSTDFPKLKVLSISMIDSSYTTTTISTTTAGKTKVFPTTTKKLQHSTEPTNVPNINGRVSDEVSEDTKNSGNVLKYLCGNFIWMFFLFKILS